MAKQDTEEKKLEPKSEVDEVGPCKLKLRIEVAAEKVEERINDKYKSLNDSVALPGFRKGHAPRNLLQRKFGKAILDDLKGDLLAASFEEVRDERKLEPLGEPDINQEKLAVVAGEPFVFEMTLEVRPTIELGTYTGLKVERPAVEVEDADVDRVLEGFREAKAELVTAPDPAKEKDQVICDVAFLVEGRQIEKGENTTIILHDDVLFMGLHLPEIHKEFLGKKPGDDVEHEVDLPESFVVKDAAGKKGLLKMKLKSVKRKRLPELTEEFAKSFDMDSIDEMREHIGKRVKREKEAQAKALMADLLIRQIVDAGDFPLPEGLVKTSTEEVLQRQRMQFMMQGLKEEELEKKVEESRKAATEGMAKTLKAHFVVEEIAEKERIFVTEDQVEERIQRLAAEHGRWPHEMKQYLEENNLMAQLRRQMREDAVRAFLLDKAEITEPSKKEKKEKSSGT
ncbi:MAG: trigger factor [Planctomycetota bacterium]|jgi:trigger factor